MREFVSKSKKMKVTIAGNSYEMKCPTLGETSALSESISGADPQKVMSIYVDFFVRLGLPKDVTMNMDNEDFTDFVVFVLSPKKEGSQPKS